RAQSRPDMGWLMSLVWKLEALPEVRKHLCLIANTAAHIRRGRIFLLEELPGGKPKPSIEVSVKATGSAVRALTLARQPISHASLVEALLSSAPGATPEKVEALISTLWQHTLLFTDLRPSLTASHPIVHIQQRLAAIPALTPLLVRLQDFLVAVMDWSASLEDEGVTAYRELQEQARKIEDLIDAMSLEGQAKLDESAHSSRPTPSSTGGLPAAPLQVDLAWPLAGTHVAKAVGEEVAAVTDVLLRLSALSEGDPGLTAYRQAFTERYGDQREVPLLELFDPQFGLGPPAHYTSQSDSLAVAQNLDTARRTIRNQTLLHLAMSALRDRRLAVQLDEETLRRLETGTLSPGRAIPSLDINMFVLASSARAIDAGEFRLVLGPNVGAMQAGRNLGRFAHLLGSEADAALKQTAQREEAQAPQQIWAELEYLPTYNRMANVLIRPLVRSHAIVYGGTPGRNDARVIPFDEIVIGVRNQRFYARWAVRNKELIICAGHMLNPAQAPKVVRFLSELPHDDRHCLSSFSWGAAVNLPFLPRLELGRIVIEPARWNITQSAHLPELSLDTPERFQASLQVWRERWNVPRYVSPGVFDNRLLLDLQCSRQAEELRADLRRLKEGEKVVLYEGLPAPTDAWVEGPGGHYVTEIVVSLALRQPPIARKYAFPAPQPLENSSQESAALRLRPLGSEWLFMKLYCAQALQDTLLAGPVRIFAESALAARYAEDWFFIRYADPEPHIRLRFRGEPEVLLKQLLPELSAWGRHLMSEGPCLKFTFDVYDREIERYGGPVAISLAETLFGADTRAVVNLLHLIQSNRLPIDMLLLAMLTADDLLAGLGLTAAQRLEWYHVMVPFLRESGATYRKKKAQLRSLFGDPVGLLAIPGGEVVRDILVTRKTTLAQVAQQLSGALSQQQSNQHLSMIYRSYVHMHCNRLGLDPVKEREVLQLLLRTHEGLIRSPTSMRA
ncbi:MAG TPA: lantibiotic dehydratase, partial [Ktedonobacteraceae bacterium]|nr:lantibiotic dehydratase [Ktedonobacteraceae bacterium]